MHADLVPCVGGLLDPLVRSQNHPALSDPALQCDLIGLWQVTIASPRASTNDFIFGQTASAALAYPSAVPVVFSLASKSVIQFASTTGSVPAKATTVTS